MMLRESKRLTESAQLFSSRLTSFAPLLRYLFLFLLIIFQRNLVLRGNGNVRLGRQMAQRVNACSATTRA